MEVETFHYPSLPAGSASSTGQGPEGQPGEFVGFAQRSGASTEEKEQQARKRAFEQGKAAARAEFDLTITGLREQLARTLAAFAAERRSYFQKAEEQVVQLALAIARKILHRESQIDPLLLAGILRVALERLDGNSVVRLRAHPRDIQLWSDYFSRVREQFPAPELIGDPGLEPQQCILETELGSTEIGLETQMKEIERGFLDLLAQRPAR